MSPSTLSPPFLSEDQYRSLCGPLGAGDEAAHHDCAPGRSPLPLLCFRLLDPTIVAAFESLPREIKARERHAAHSSGFQLALASLASDVGEDMDGTLTPAIHRTEERHD